METVVALVVGLSVGLVAVWLVTRRRPAGEGGGAAVDRDREEALASELAEARAELAGVRATLQERTERLATAIVERDQAWTQLTELRERHVAATEALAELRADHEARRQELEKQRAELDTHFKGIASAVVQSTSEEFLKQAQENFTQQRALSGKDLEARQQAVEHLVKPVRENLDKLERHVTALEKQRTGAYEGIQELINQTQKQLGELRGETGGLREALRSPQARGQWGEQTLQNILDLAGMREGVDYLRQARETVDSGTIQPDVVVTLPQGKRMVIDSKAPADSYLNARESGDEAARKTLLGRHAERMLQHARELHHRQYATAEDSLDFVVMFVASDAVLDAALEARPAIWEESWRDYRVLLASPAVLIALLNGVAAGLQQEKLHENAEAIRREGQTLYRRLSTYATHITRLGKSLSSAVDHYNKSVGSLETSVLPQARRFEELGAVAAASELAAVEPLEMMTREIAHPELLESGGD